MSRSEARFLARMLFGHTRTLSDEQRSEQSERARKTITKEELRWRGEDRAARMRRASKPARLNVSVSNPSRMMRMIRNLLSARHRKSPGRVNRGFISWRVRGAGG